MFTGVVLPCLRLTRLPGQYMKPETVMTYGIPTVTVLGWLWYIFNRNTKIDKNASDIAAQKVEHSERMDALEAKLDTISAQLYQLHTTLEKLSVALWGIDGNNGLRGEVKELKELMWDHLHKTPKHH